MEIIIYISVISEHIVIARTATTFQEQLLKIQGFRRIVLIISPAKLVYNALRKNSYYVRDLLK